MTTGDTAHQAALRDQAIETWDEVHDGPDTGEAYLQLIEARLRPGARVADIGCGTGHILGELHRRAAARSPALGLTLLGVDPSAPMLEIARRKLGALDGLSFAQAEAGGLPLAAGTVDVALSRLADYDLGELARVLVPGGVFVEYGLGPLDSAEVAVAFGARYTCEYDARDPDGWLRRRGEGFAAAGFETEHFEVVSGVDYLTRSQLVETIAMVPLVEPFDAAADAAILDAMATATRDGWDAPRIVVHRQVTLRVARRLP
jgi:SAM-dependent methyltransferase